MNNFPVNIFSLAPLSSIHFLHQCHIVHYTRSGLQRRMELNPERIISLGVSLAGGEQLQKEGDFRLGLHSITAKRDE